CVRRGRSAWPQWRHCSVVWSGAYSAGDRFHQILAPRYPVYSQSARIYVAARASKRCMIPERKTARTFTTHSAEETTELGRKLAAEIKPGSVVLLRGELGAGKTTLAKGIAEGFNAAEAAAVTSPTFTLIHEYRGPETTVYHIDLYRIDTQRELDTLAIDDLMESNSILLIEWGEKFERFV